MDEYAYPAVLHLITHSELISSLNNIIIGVIGQQSPYKIPTVSNGSNFNKWSHRERITNLTEKK